MNDSQHHKRTSPPLQFGLPAILMVTAVTAVLFATLRWLGVGPVAGCIVLAILVVGAVAAGALVVVIAAAVPGEDDEDIQDH